MNHVPTNRILFWTCYAVGTFGPISVNFLLNQFRRPFDDGAFLLSWLAWLFGTGLLIACVWSVRAVLLCGSSNSQRPAWLYRAFGWLALAELLSWAYTCVRVI